LARLFFIHRDQRFVSINNTFLQLLKNALFSKNLTTNVVKTTNTIDGLSGQTISALYHSAASNKTLGYENGLIIAINETDGTLLNIVDIINKRKRTKTIYPLVTVGLY
jgi:hypothetical protein